MPGDVAITVGGTKYPLKVIKQTYTKRDVTDFAPRATSGSTSLATQGLYLDVAQEGFGHGFGKVEFGEPMSYHYSGSGVDTRYGFIGLYTTPVADTILSVSYTAFVTHRSLPVWGTSTGFVVRRPSSGALTTITPAGYSTNALLSTGRYFYATQGGAVRMQLCDMGQATAGGASTISLSGAGWAVNVFTGGAISIFDGTAFGDARTVASNTADTITVTAPFSATPTTSSYFLVWVNTGSAVNTATNFSKVVTFGGEFWSYEVGTNRVHHWSEETGSDAEGGTAEASVIYIGPTGLGIVNLMPFQNQLWVFRPDGAWVINEQDTDVLAYHTLDFSAESSTSNFAAVTVWQGFLIFTVRNKIYKYRSGLLDVTPPVWDEYPPYKQFGDFKVLLPIGKYLYAIGRSNEANSDETTETTTGFATLMATDGVGWHRLLDISLTTPTDYDMWIDPVANYIYYSGYVSPYSSMWHVPLQAYSDLPYASFPTSGAHNLYTSYFDVGMRRIDKSFATFTLQGDFPATTSVVVSYRRDTTLTWTTLGTIDTDMEELSFPVGTTGKRIQFRLALATTTAANTPVIKALVLKLMIRPTVLYGVTCDVVISNNLADSHHELLGLTARQIETALVAARDSVSPITFTDISGTDGTVYLSSLTFRLVEFEDAEGLQYIAHCNFVYVS